MESVEAVTVQPMESREELEGLMDLLETLDADGSLQRCLRPVPSKLYIVR